MESTDSIQLDSTIRSGSIESSVISRRFNKKEEKSFKKIEEPRIKIKDNFIEEVKGLSVPPLKPMLNQKLMGESMINSREFDENFRPSYLKYKDVPSLFTIDTKDKIDFSIKNSELSMMNKQDVNTFQDGYTSIFAIKLILEEKKITSNDKPISNLMEKRDISKIEYDKFVLIWGPLLVKNENVDDQGNRTGKDKIVLRHIKINVLIQDDFLNFKHYFNNLLNHSPVVGTLMNYLYKFFVYFKKLKENIGILKNSNIRNLFIFTINNIIESDSSITSNSEVQKTVESLTFDDVFNNIFKFGNLVESHFSEILDDKIINELDYKSVKKHEILSEFSIKRDLDLIKQYYLDNLLLKYDLDKIKKNYNGQTRKNELQAILMKILLNKIKKHYTKTFQFCCFDRNFFEKLFEDPIKGREELSNYFLCYQCVYITCKKCFKYHNSHKEQTLTFEIFKADHVFNSLTQKLRTKEREKLEKILKSVAKPDRRKYIILADFVKVFVCEYLTKEMLKYKDDFQSLKNEFLKDKLFTNFFVRIFNKKKEKDIFTYLFSQTENVGDNKILPKLQMKFFALNKDILNNHPEKNFIVNRNLIEDMYYTFVSNELNTSKVFLKNPSKTVQNEGNIYEVNTFISNMYSPKQLFREIFVKKEYENTFLENYFLPKNSKSIKLLNKENNLEIFDAEMSGSFLNDGKDENEGKKEVEEKLEVNESYAKPFETDNRDPDRFNTIKRADYIPKIENQIFNKENIMEIEKNNNQTIKRNKVKKTTTITRKFLKTGTIKSAKVVENVETIKENDDEIDLKVVRTFLMEKGTFVNDEMPRMKLIIVFLEEMIEMIENYGFMLNDDDLKQNLI